jgi:hypothetical protein
MSRMHDQGAVDGGAAPHTPPTERGPIGKRHVALDAMARAALRARDPARDPSEPTIRSPRATNHPRRADAPTEHPPTRRQADRSSRLLPHPPHTRRTARLRALTLAALAALLLVLATLVAVWASGVGSRAPERSAVRVTTPRTGHGRATTPSSIPAPVAPQVPVTQGSTTTVTQGPATTTSSLPPATASGSAPRLSALAPSQGSAGQVLTLSGTNLFSPDGQITVMLGNQVAPTSCSTQSTCSVTVPSIPGGQGSIPVSVTTAAGTSNALTFQYQAS